MRQASNTITIEKTRCGHMCIHFLDNRPDRFGVCQACKSAARSQCAWQCADRTNSWRSGMFSHTFWGAHWACTINILQFQGPKRSCECEAILVGFGLHVELFCKPTLGSQVSASQLMRSTRQRERNTWCHFGPCPHPIKFDFTRWVDIRGNYRLHSPCQQLGSWFHVPISNVSPSKNRCLIIYIISHLLSNCSALACANNVFAPASARLRLEMGNSQCCAWALPRLWRSKCGLSSMSQLRHGIEFFKILKKFTRRNMKRPGQLLNLHRTNDKMSWGRTEAPAAVVRNKIPGKAWSCVQGPHPNQWKKQELRWSLRFPRYFDTKNEHANP